MHIAHIEPKPTGKNRDIWLITEASGLQIKTKYPANRMAKALEMQGKAGKLTTYINGKPSMTVDIQDYAKRALSETDANGFTWKGWTPQTLAQIEKCITDHTAT